MITDVMKWLWGTSASKMSNSSNQNKDRLSIYRILLLQRKPKLGRTKPSTGPRVGHS